MAGVAGREEEAGQGIDGGDHRDAVGSRIDHAAPGMRHLQPLQRGVVIAEPREAALDQHRIGGGIERALALEGRFEVERPVGKGFRPFEERAADAEGEAGPALLEGRPELAGIEQALRRQLDEAASTQPDRIAAIKPAPDRDVRHGKSTIRHYRRRGRCKGGRAHAGLCEPQIVAAAEEGAPGAAGQQHGLRADDPALGDDARNHAVRDVEAARRTILVERGAEPACALRDCRPGQRRLGAAVGG